MNAQNLINRLVAKRLQDASVKAFCQPQRNAKAICINRAACVWQKAACVWKADTK